MKKRRFYEGGFNDYEGAIGSGADTPDKAIARKAAADVLAGRAGDKAAGLASTKGQDVGFFKRLSMGNIDAPGSEASNSFGAGKGSSDRMAQAADQDPPVRPVQRPTPVAPVAMRQPADRIGMDTSPAPVGLGEITDEAGTKSKFRRNTETGEAYDPGSATDKKPVAVKKPTVKPSISASDKPMPPVGSMKNPRDAKKGMSRDILKDESWKATAKAAQDEVKDDAVFRARAKAAQDAAKPVKRAGILQRMRDQDNARKKTGEASRRQDSGDLGTLFPLKRGGNVKAYAQGGSVSSRADGCAQRGKTRGMMR